MEISEIKSLLTLKAVLDYYHLKPDRNLRLNCPFHEDKTPSLQVYYKTHTVYCFSSNCKTHGKSMDVIDFILHKENCSKHEAINKAVAILGYYEGKTQHHQRIIPSVNDPAKLTLPREQFLANMFTYFRNAVSNSKPAKDYLASRGLFSPIEGIKGGLEVGYNTAQFHHGARRDEVLINNCVAVGLLAPWGVNNRKPDEQAYKAFGKECICFALRNKENQITGLYFRSTTPSNSSKGGETNAAKHFYLKQSTGLYPKYPDPSTEKLIITESIIDAASLLQIESVAKEYSILAAYGTNRLNEEMKSAIKELPYLKEIVFAFDSDEAGNKAIEKYAQELKVLLPSPAGEGLGVRFTKLELPCKDVNETLIAHTEEIFIHLLGERKPVFEEAGISKSVIHHKTQEVPKNNPSLDITVPHKIKYQTETAIYYIQGGLPKTTDHLKIMLVIETPLSSHGEGAGVRKARNKIDLYEDKQVEKLCKEVAEKLGIRKDFLEADVYRLTDLLEQHIEKNLQAADNGQITTVMLTDKERQELEAFARKPKLIKQLNELLGEAGIVGEERNRIFLLIIAISHKMPETLHALIQGSSGSGKTRLLKQVSDCMPKENVTRLTRLSDKVLYNFPESYFINRLLCLEDIDGLSEEAEFAFRELQSNGELNSATSIKLENGQITSGQKTVKGPIASLACTTKGEIYEDNMSRVFLIAVDESTKQTKKIIEYQNKKAAGLIDSSKENEVKTFIQKFISILQPYNVINPFAGKIQLPPEAHKIRRLNDLFQSFIKMVTLLNQYQRKTDEQKRLITRIEDIETAVAVMFESILLKVDELDGSLRQFYEQLKSYLQKQYPVAGGASGSHQTAEFTLREVRQALKVSKMQVFRYINDLQQLEYVKQNGGYANRGYTYKIMYWDNYEIMRGRIKNSLQQQLKSLKEPALPPAG